MRKGTLNFWAALIGGVFAIVHAPAIAAEKSTATYSNVKSPYKTINGVLHYQSAVNLPAVPMKNVKPEDDSLIYSDTAFGVGKANGTYSYKKSVNIFEQCFGWATIDDALYYRGEKNSEV